MLTIISEDISSVKTEMKAEECRLKDEIKLLKKNRKGLKSERPDEVERVVTLEKKIEHLKQKLKIYNPSKVFPVQVGSLIVCYKTYETFMKKIKGFRVETTVDSDSVKIHYRKNKEKGSLTLIDMSEFFEGFQHIPEAVLDDQET